MSRDISIPPIAELLERDALSYSASFRFERYTPAS